MPVDNGGIEHRPLGRTGVSVSKFCLGAMMFGAWGNPDHDESIRIIHARSTPGSTSSTPPTSTARASPRRSSARRSPAAGATTSSSPPSSTTRWARTPTGAATPGAGSCARSRTRCGGWAPTGSTSTRSTAPTRHRHRGDAVGADRPRPPGQGPLHRLLDLPRRADRRGAVGRARPAACSASSPSSRRTRSSSAASRPTSCPPARATAWASCPTARWPAAGCRAAGARTPGSSRSSRAGRLPERFDLSRPANQRKLDAVEELAQLAEEAGITLIELAIAFVLNHPAITAAIIGPRTMEQLESQLAAADVVLDEACWTASTRSSRPARRINPADNSFANPALEPAARRRLDRAWGLG